MISSFSSAVSKREQSMRIWWSRQISSFSMKYTMNTSFSTCLSLSPPPNHMRIPSQTRVLLLRLVAMRRARMVPTYLLRSSSVSLVSLRQSFTRCCSVAKAWSILDISRKAASFLLFTFRSNDSFYLMRFLRRSKWRMANYLLCWRDTNVLRRCLTCSINWLTLSQAACSPRKYCWVASALLLVSSRMALLSQVTCWCSASVRSGKA